jgi:hypothetical protein
VRPGTHDLELRLPAVHEVRGRVVRADGTPLALPHPFVPPPGSPSATVYAERLDDDGVDPAPVLYGEGTGEFVLRYVPAGRYRLCALSEYDEHDDAGEPRVGGSVVVDVPGPPVRIVCAPMHTLEGRILGDDVAGFWAIWFPDARPTEDASEVQQCQDDGTFRFEDMEDEPGTLYFCRRDDPRHGWVERVWPSQGPLAVRLRPGLSITGRVEGLGPDDAGRVHVNALQGPLDQDATVESDGRFHLVGLRPGRYDLTVRIRTGRSSVDVARLAGVAVGSDVVIEVP